MASGPVTSWQIHGETKETVRDFMLWGSNITADDDCSHENKRCIRQVLGPGELGRPRGSDREGGGRGDRNGEYM